MKKFAALLSVILTLAVLFSIPILSIEADDDTVVVGDLTVHFIDVGQGDSCVVELPDHRTMLIDAGKSEYGKTVEKYVNDNIKDESGKTIEYFDYVIFTHSDSDHIGGMSYILGKFDAKVVYRPNEECKYHKGEFSCVDKANDGVEARNRFWGKQGDKATATYHNALEKAYEVADEVIVTNPYDDEQNRITSTGDKAYEVNFYSPLSASYTDHNNYSPIIIIEYMGRRVVLTGDAEKKNEAEFVAKANEGEGRYAIFDNRFCADVIKLGHHGSRTSSSEDYLNVVTNAAGRKNVFVVISCGVDNEYGHPHPEVLERLSKLGFSDEKILRTDKLGDIVITVALVDGSYKAVCSKSGESVGGESGGEPGEEPGEVDPIVKAKNWFDSLDLVTKILIIVGIIVVVVIVVAIVVHKIKNGGKSRRRR